MNSEIWYGRKNRSPCIARIPSGCKFDFIYRLVGQFSNEKIDFRFNPELYGCPWKPSVLLLVSVSIAVPIVIGLIIMGIIKICICKIQQNELREFEATQTSNNYVTENPLYREYKLRSQTTHTVNPSRYRQNK